MAGEPRIGVYVCHCGSNIADIVDSGQVARFAQFRAVEVDQVQPLGPLGHPALGHLGRIVAEDGFLGIIALPQPHAFTAAQVDRGPNLHRHGLPPPQGALLTCGQGKRVI